MILYFMEDDLVAPEPYLAVEVIQLKLRGVKLLINEQEFD